LGGFALSLLETAESAGGPVQGDRRSLAVHSSSMGPVSRRSAPRRAPSISSPSGKEADRCLVVGHDSQREPVVARGQMLDRDQERELDRFAGDDRLVRPVACIGDLAQ
jgi:hypothetical protein